LWQIPNGSRIITHEHSVDYGSSKERMMSNMMTTAQIVKESRQALRRATRKAMRNKKTAIAFLVRAGILEKSGKRLAKPYR
jgi:hypothetical protein